MTRDQKNKMYQTFVNEILKLTDANGNKIFRANKKIFEIQRTNGEKLPSVSLKSTEMKYSMSAENSVDNEIQKADSVTREQITKVLKNKDITAVLEQFGAKVKNGKVIYPDEQTKARVINYVKSLQNPDSSTQKMLTTPKKNLIIQRTI